MALPSVHLLGSAQFFVMLGLKAEWCLLIINLSIIKSKNELIH